MLIRALALPQLQPKGVQHDPNDARTSTPNCWSFTIFYAHGRISKREFLEKAGRYAVGGLTAAAILGMMGPNYALAEQVSFNDPDIVGDYVMYPSPNGHGEVRGYLAKPAAITGKLPAVVVVHDRGLNYIEDVTRRLAKAGFLALAPDGLTSRKGYPGNDSRTRIAEQVDPPS